MMLSLAFVLSVWAQERTITGKVADAETGETVPGANILEKGTSNGTTTDFDGNFRLSVQDGATLVVSFVGYKQQEVAIGSRSVIDVDLELDVAQLAEVVVIGYGETSVKDATGAVAAVSAKDFNGGVISSPEQLIQGKTAGVQITSTSGAPGAGVELRIRGTNSVRSNNNPLFVVDGVPLAGDNTAAEGANVGFGTGGSSNPLNFLNPSDIESISILKDASSAAIYGSRGANGVVFITTKKGAGNTGTLDLASSVSISAPANDYDLLDRDGFLSAVSQFGGDASLNDFGNNTDWQDEITRTSVSHKQNLSYSKGYTDGSVRASIGYEDQQGIIENSSLERLTGRINVNHNLFDERLNLNLSVTGSNVDEEYAPVGGSAGFRGDLLGGAYSANPTWPTDIESLSDQEITGIIGGQIHPGNLLSNYQSTGETNRLLLNFAPSYKITDDLTVKLAYGLDASSSEVFALTTANARNMDRGTTGNGRGAYSEIDVTNNLFEGTLSYDKDFGNSRLEALVGYSFQDFQREGFNSEGWGFASTDFGQMESDLSGSANTLIDLANSRVGGFWQQVAASDDIRGGDQTTGVFVNALLPTVGTSYFGEPTGVNVNSVFVNRFNTTDELQSFFGRFNYTLQNKYILTFTMRADGSSRFGEDERYGFFPSGAFAWKIHEEGFAPSAFSSLKLRLGYGITGNQDGLGHGQYLDRRRYDDRLNNAIGDGGEVQLPGINAVALVNPNLKWEETTQFSAGFDFGLMNERLYGSLDFYRKETTDIILRLNAAQPSPTQFIFQNFDATVVNQGFEFSLNYDLVDNDDLTWTISGNYSYNDNEIQDFDGLIPAGTIRGQGLSEAFAQLLTGGQALFTYFLREFDGFDAEGQPIGDIQSFTDQSALPTSNLGISMNVRYQNFDLATYFTGQFGHHIYNNTRNAFFTAGAIGNARNVTTDVIGSGEAASAEASVSTRFLERGDFFRMQNLTLGYNFDLPDTFIRNLRLYFNAQNLFLIASYDGLDPEISSQPGAEDLLNRLPTAGIDYTAYPRPRVFTIGLNASF